VTPRSTRLRLVAATFAVLLAMVTTSSGLGGGGGFVGSAVAGTKPRKPRPIATAPFTAPTDVVLADTPPPWALPADARPYVEAAGLAVLRAEQLAVHYHAHLDVIDASTGGGAEITVPAGIGFEVKNGKATGLSVLHTHDTSGIIHVESAKNKPYTLGQVFTEWGVALSETQLGGLHADATHVLAAYVNGRRFSGDPATLRLQRHLEIALWYGPSDQKPKVPTSYRFPAGL
jgi:hypothetical protein